MKQFINNPLKLAFVACVLIGSSAQAAKVKKVTAPLTTKITAVSVDVAPRHAYVGVIGRWGLWGKHTSCDTFTGTFEGNDVHIHLQGSGGSGSYKHRIVTSFGESYRIGRKRKAQIERKKNGNGDLQVSIPELADNVPFVQQTILLMTTDSAGNTATDALIFTVSRPIIVNPSQRREDRETNCFQRYAPYEAMTGVLSNATNNLSEIEIKQGVEKIWTSTHGWQFGVFVSPLSVLQLGNLIVFNYSYFQETSKSVIETTEVNTKFAFDPGDYMQVYAQPTRYVTSYDATLVEACGQRTTMQGAYHFQWWGFSYLVHPINPYSKVPPSPDVIGAPVMNSCPEDLNPERTDNTSFRKMN